MMRRFVSGLVLLAVISLGALTVVATDSTGMLDREVEVNRQATKSQAYTTRYSIEIYNNEEMQTMAISESWDGDGSEEDPYVIAGYRLTATDTQPIRIWNVDLHWEFRNNIIEWGDVCGTWFASAENGLIEQNTFHGRHSGMVIQNCANLIIRNNVVENNTANGIEILGGSVNLTIEGNQVSDSGLVGILMPITSNFIVVDNVITRSGTSGIEAIGLPNALISGNTINASGAHGLDLYSITDSRVTHNIIADSELSGIYIESGSQNFISKNWVENSTSHGISLDSECSNTTVRGSVFIDNGVTCQACDNGTDNIFEYNYYDDWISPDADSDGFVDLPYEIAGTAVNEDPYPRIGPWVEVPCRFTTPTTTTTTTTTSTTTTTTDVPPPIPMEYLLVGGGALALVAVLAVVLVRRK